MQRKDSDVELKNPEDNTLYSKLKNSINDYLENDNPAPKSISDSFANLFSSRGASGRTRAMEYKGLLKAYAAEQQLTSKVLQDIRAEGGPLGSSTVLREKLLDVCKLHYHLNDTDISHKSSALYMNAYGAILCQYRPVYIESAYRVAAITALIAESHSVQKTIANNMK